MERLAPGMQQVLIKIRCCHYEPPTLTYPFRKIQWGAGGGETRASEPRSCHPVGETKRSEMEQWWWEW